MNKQNGRFHLDYSNDWGTLTLHHNSSTASVITQIREDDLKDLLYLVQRALEDEKSHKVSYARRAEG
jgi:hypothetical protein